MPRFFYPSELAIGMVVVLPDKVSHHCQVLRLNVGDPIILFNGEGGSYVACLTAIQRKSATAEVKTFTAQEVESNFSITLAQAVPESNKMDWIVEKAVELGAHGIQPLTTQRCVTRLSEERADKRTARWQTIIESASEQCGRNRLAVLGQVTRFTDWIHQQDLHKRLILSPYADHSLAEWAKHHPAQAVTIMVGPEGGFSEQELQLAMSQGVTPLSMGRRILRTETAGLSAISTINAHWDEM